MNKTYDTPSDSEVLGEDDIPNAIDVEVKNVVRVDEMPTRSGGATTVNAPVGGIKILNGDDRRKSATIISLDQDIIVGNIQGDVLNTAGGARWPVNTPLVITSADEWWAASVTGTTDITLIIENWAR